MSGYRCVADVCAFVRGLREGAEAQGATDFVADADAMLRVLEESDPRASSARFGTFATDIIGKMGPVRTLTDVRGAVGRLRDAASRADHGALTMALQGIEAVLEDVDTEDDAVSRLASALGLDGEEDVEKLTARAGTAQNIAEAFEDTFGTDRNPWDDLQPVETLWKAAKAVNVPWEDYCAELLQSADRPEAADLEEALAEAQRERDEAQKREAELRTALQQLHKELKWETDRAEKARGLALQIAETLALLS